MEALLELYRQFKIIHVAGESGSGKSLLAQTLGQYFIQTRKRKVILVDTMQKFSQQRFQQCFPNPVVQNNFLVAQARSFNHQKSLIKNLRQMATRNRLQDTGLLIFDSISHFLRKEISARDYAGYIEILDLFYESTLQDLLFLALHYKIRLLFVHEMSYKPPIGTLPFLHDFFDEIRGAWVSLKCTSYEKVASSPDPKHIDEIDRFDPVVAKYSLQVPSYIEGELLEVERIPYQINASGIHFSL